MRNEEDINSYNIIKESDTSSLKKKAKTEKKKNKKGKKKKRENNSDSELDKESDSNGDQFLINKRYSLIKMLGSGSFGEIHLAMDLKEKKLHAIKFVRKIIYP